jgi:ribonuclease J
MKQRECRRLSELAKLSLIPLGGTGEIGKNLQVLEYNDEILIIDCGVKFPDDEMLGIDLVIPDIAYLLPRKEQIKGIIITHGHEDHIGALPFILNQLNAPLYGTKLTVGLVEAKLKNNGIVNPQNLHIIKPREILKLGSFEVEAFSVAHSIPDAVGYAIQTPVGLIVYSGDFKIDHTPSKGENVDFERLAHYGKQGVLAFICDSTNVERPGYTMSEQTVGETFDQVFNKAKQRIIVTTFASNVYRIQQVLDAAIQHGRKVAVVGRSMVEVTETAMRLGYLVAPEGTLIELDEIAKLPPDEVVIITTGSQGEPMAALTKMATQTHRQINIQAGDTVIISATPIPGNEKLVGRTINNLFKIGANVVSKEMARVHVSGHASQEEVKLVLSLLKPKFIVPHHGEYRHQVAFARLAEAQGYATENVILTEIGDRIQFTAETAKKAGKVESGSVLIDGLGIGDVGTVVLRDRQLLGQDGVVVVVLTLQKRTGKILAGPDIVSRGVVFIKESSDLLDEARAKIAEALEKQEETNEWSVVKNVVRDALGQFMWARLRRKPIILPVIMEV